MGTHAKADEDKSMPRKSIRQYASQRIKELRSDKSMTQAELARKSGINRSYLADIEMGNRNFGIDTLEKIIKGLGIGYAEFFSGTH